MTYLLIFLGGVVFIQFIMPLLDTIFQLAITCLHTVEQKVAVKMSKYQKEILDMHLEDDQQETHAIGFIVDEEEEENGL